MSVGEAPAGAGRILCVEDDSDARDLLTLLLEREGYTVDGVETGDEGLERLIHASYDLVITDYNLPDRDGSSLLLEAHRRGLLGEGGAMIVTAHPDPDSLERPPGVKTFRKPIDVDDLVASVHDALKTIHDREFDALEQRAAAPAEKHRGEPKVQLALYVSRGSRTGLKAVRNLQRLLARTNEGAVSVTVYDLAQTWPACAEEDRIAFTPTLVRRFPLPRVRILGDLTRSEALADLLEDAGVKVKTQ